MATSDDGRWLSYSELASERGISRQSAVRLVRRQRWRRQMGNDGEARVFVPVDQLPGAAPPANGTGHDTGHDTGLLARGLAALEDAVAGLREQLRGANVRADTERQRAEDLRAQIDVLHAEMAAAVAEERQRADALLQPAWVVLVGLLCGGLC